LLITRNKSIDGAGAGEKISLLAWPWRLAGSGGVETACAAWPALLGSGGWLSVWIVHR
jgi:hypothetical protein